MIFLHKKIRDNIDYCIKITKVWLCHEGCTGCDRIALTYKGAVHVEKMPLQILDGQTEIRERLDQVGNRLTRVDARHGSPVE